MVVFETCCGCVRLTSGTIALGSIHLISSLIELVVASVFYSEIDDLWERGSPPNNVLSQFLPTYISQSFTLAVVCILMIWGVLVRSHFLILPWLVIVMIVIILYGIVVPCVGVYFMVLSVAPELQLLLSIGVILFVFGILGFGINLYLWLCVLSCFQELRDNSYRDETVLLEDAKSSAVRTSGVSKVY